jgi:uncharacterized membrane protein YgcG
VLPHTGLMVLIDDTFDHESFFSGADVQAAISIAIQDPAFYRADIGMIYTSGPASCGPMTPTYDVKLESATTVVPKIQASIPARDKVVLAKSGGPPEIPRFDEGLRVAFEELSKAPASGPYFRRAVMLIGERDFLGTACVANPATDTAQARASTASADGPNQILTHVFDLAGNTNDPFPLDADQLAAAGGTQHATDSRGSNKGPAKEGFQRVIEQLATCVYEPPKKSDALPIDGTLSYNDPLDVKIVRSISHVDGCKTGKEAVDGWDRGADNRIYICGKSCDDYRTTLKNAGIPFIPYAKPGPAIPVFAHKAGCGPKPDATNGGNGTSSSGGSSSGGMSSSSSGGTSSGSSGSMGQDSGVIADSGTDGG